MDSVPPLREMMRGALFGIGFAADEVATFADDVLDKLFLARFHLPGRLQAATREDLREAGLAIGDVSFIIKHLQRRAAGVGTTSSKADDDNIIMQRADVSRKFTGQVEHDVKDPTTGEVHKVPSCVIVIASKFAATFAHNRKWKEGEDVELKICSTDATSMRVVKAKVFRIDRKVDFVILKFTSEELQAPDAACGPRDGMKFYGHGLSCPKGTANVYHGIIARADFVGRAYIALGRLSGKGDSGGGIFSAATGKLLGMMVGRDKDLEKSYVIPAAVLLAAAQEEEFDPDPPPSGEWF